MKQVCPQKQPFPGLKNLSWASSATRKAPLQKKIEGIYTMSEKTFSDISALTITAQNSDCRRRTMLRASCSAVGYCAAARSKEAIRQPDAASSSRAFKRHPPGPTKKEGSITRPGRDRVQAAGPEPQLMKPTRLTGRTRPTIPRNRVIRRTRSRTCLRLRVSGKRPSSRLVHVNR